MAQLTSTKSYSDLVSTFDYFNESLPGFNAVSDGTAVILAGATSFTFNTDITSLTLDFVNSDTSDASLVPTFTFSNNGSVLVDPTVSITSALYGPGEGGIVTMTGGAFDSFTVLGGAGQITNIDVVPGAAPSPTPEPSTIGMLGAGSLLVGLGAQRFKKRAI